MKKTGEKAPRKPRPLISEPSVLILHEKHYSPVFIVQDEKALCKAALAILKARAESTNYYFEPEAPGPTDIREEAIGDLPASVQDAARKKLEEHKRRLHWFREGLIWHDRMKKALTELDGREAWRLLCDRSDHEYERVELRRAERPEKYGA